jgi:hypothetical protein
MRVLEASGISNGSPSALAAGPHLSLRRPHGVKPEGRQGHHGARRRPRSERRSAPPMQFPILGITVLLAAFLLARRGELCRLRWSDLSWNAGTRSSGGSSERPLLRLVGNISARARRTSGGRCHSAATGWVLRARRRGNGQTRHGHPQKEAEQPRSHVPTCCGRAGVHRDGIPPRNEFERATRSRPPRSSTR